MELHSLVAAARDLGPTILALADEIEAQRRLPDSLVSTLSDAGLFRMSVPREYGGDELDPGIVFEVLEALAMADASTAWVVMIIAANPFLLGNAVYDEVWQTIYGDNPDARSAGHIGPNGRATPVAGGYQVSGHWKYGSGSEHCQYLISGCMVWDGAKPRLDDHGQPELLWVLHQTRDCKILTDTWNTTGLCGSGSHDYVIEDLFVADNWTLKLGDTVNPLRNPMYTFSVLPFCQIAAITGALAQVAIDDVLVSSRSKRRGPRPLSEDPSIQMQVARAQALRNAGRSYMKDELRNIMNALDAGGTLTPEQRGNFRLAATYATDCAIQAVDMMYKLGGGNAIYKGNRLERVFRDAHTAGTHLQLNDLTYVKSGRVLLGVDPEDPLF